MSPSTARRRLIDADKIREQVKDAKQPDKEKRRKPTPPRDNSKEYMEKQTAEQTPMVFVTLDASLETTVVEPGRYRLTLLVDGEPTLVEKLTLQYHYKQVDAGTVAEKVGVDESVRSKGEAAPAPYRERHNPSNRDLWYARKERISVRITLRSGVVFTGMVEWFTNYEVKLDIGVRREGGGAGVILHRHAVLRVELLEEPKEEPKLDPPPDAEPKADEG